MNRLEAPAQPFPTAPAPVTGLDLLEGWVQESFESQAPEPPLATFSPMHYESGYAYPLVVWMHDAGQSEHDLAAVMAHVSTRNYVAVAPGAAGGRDRPWPQGSGGVAETEQRVFDAIEAAGARFNIHSDRVFLAGAGRGGTAALRLALAYPDCFAGVASFDGAAPTGQSPLRRLNAVRGMPLMLATGGDSDRYPDERFCDDIRLLHAAGCQLHLRHEPGDGDLTIGMLSEFDRWMMSIVCGSGVAATK